LAAEADISKAMYRNVEFQFLFRRRMTRRH